MFDSKKLSQDKIRTWADVLRRFRNWYMCAPRNNSKHFYKFSPSLLKVESIEYGLKQTLKRDWIGRHFWSNLSR